MSEMEQFQFVTLTHPDAVKDKKNQGMIRGHAIRISAQKARKSNNFLAVEIDPIGHRPVKRSKKQKRPSGLPLKAPSISRLDPFDSLPSSSTRLEELMRHPAAKQAGEPVFTVNHTISFQSLDQVFHGALADPALFHVLLLSLASAANGGTQDVECLAYRGAAIKYIHERLSDPAQITQGSTLLAVLLLVGFEYRVDGANASSVQIHLKAAQEIIRICDEANVFFCDTIRRAIFWQDLISSFIVGTPRFRSHDDFPELFWKRDPFRTAFYQIQPGLVPVQDMLPAELVTILEDINALCILLGSRCMCGETTISRLLADNAQASIESRLTNLRNEIRNAGRDPLVECCIYAAYVCTYKLSTEMWEAGFIPMFCSVQMLKVLQQSELDERWAIHPDILLWLLYVGGAFADKKLVRLQYMALIHASYRTRFRDSHWSWPDVKTTLKLFIWSERTFESHFRQFFEECNPS